MAVPDADYNFGKQTDTYVVGKETNSAQVWVESARSTVTEHFTENKTESRMRGWAMAPCVPLTRVKV